MSRAPKPCGTEAAYRRHLRAGEEPCQECKRAAAHARDARRDKTKAQSRANTTMQSLLSEVFTQRRRPGDVPTLDVRAEQFSMYSLLWKALEQAAPRECAAIIKEMRGLLQDLTAGSGDEDEMSLEDEVEEARRERERRAAERAGAPASQDRASTS
ncbi:hypothetical protein [Nesterenkonia sp. K-15-9-6]|uniref:hypothetical protein n=1 Tax=Nesterenkonia sp. K-15-9-6 TaxID=3093918 RepID=UPI004044C51F